MKTAVTVLQEMTLKLGRIPEYECMSQSGPHHMVTFEYRCTCMDLTATAHARSKKEAKQEAARRLLLKLNTHGYKVQSPYDQPRGNELEEFSPPPSPTNKPALEAGPTAAPPRPSLDTRSYVALLKELCEEYHLGGVVYTLTSDTGPAHQRRFLISAQLGQHVRTASGTTKKGARQLAAEGLYYYLRENLCNHTIDFVEEEALNRALEKAMDRYMETNEKKWRANLTMKVSEYHLCGVYDNDDVIEGEKKQSVLNVLNKLNNGNELDVLEEVCLILNLKVSWQEITGLSQPSIPLMELTPSTSPLMFAGHTKLQCIQSALQYLLKMTKTERQSEGSPKSTDQ